MKTSDLKSVSGIDTEITRIIAIAALAAFFTNI